MTLSDLESQIRCIRPVACLQQACIVTKWPSFQRNIAKSLNFLAGKFENEIPRGSLKWGR